MLRGEHSSVRNWEPTQGILHSTLKRSGAGQWHSAARVPATDSNTPNRPAREVLEGGGGRGGGGLKGGGRGGGVGRTLPPPMVPLWSLPKAGRKILKLKSYWHRRRRSKILAVSLKKGGRGSKGREVGGGQGGYPRCSYGVRPF